MLREYFTNRWVIGGFCFLIVFGIACYFWYQHELAPYEQSEAESSEMLHQSERAQKAETAQAISDAPVESATPTAEKPINKTTDAVPETDGRTGEQTGPVTAATQQTETNAEEVPVSPHGFGPYPELPPDYPDYPATAWHSELTAEGELLIRVHIKLWKQGIRALGGNMRDDGLIYPTLPGVVYVKWKRTVLPDGTVEKSVADRTGDPHMGKILWNIELQKGKVLEKDIPPEVKVVDMAEAGIDPYEFLGLPSR